MARSFTRASDHYLDNGNAVVDVPPLSFAAWVYPDEVTGISDLLWCGPKTSDTNRFLLHLRGDQAGDPGRMRVRNDAALIKNSGTTSGYTANSWQHVCGTIDNSSPNVIASYLDGGNKGTETITNDWSPRRTTPLSGDNGAIAYSRLPNQQTVTWPRLRFGTWRSPMPRCSHCRWAIHPSWFARNLWSLTGLYLATLHPSLLGLVVSI